MLERLRLETRLRGFFACFARLRRLRLTGAFATERRRLRTRLRLRGFAASFALRLRLRLTGLFAVVRRRLRLTVRFTVERAELRLRRLRVTLRFATCLRALRRVTRLRACERLRLLVTFDFVFLRVLRIATPWDPALRVRPLASRGRRRRLGRRVGFGVAPPARRAAARARARAANCSRAAICFGLGVLFRRMPVSFARRMWPANARDSGAVKRRARARRAFGLSPLIAARALTPDARRR